MADGKVLFDMACDRVLARFQFKNMKYLRKSVSLEKLENGRLVFEIQPTESWS